MKFLTSIFLIYMLSFSLQTNISKMSKALTSKSLSTAKVGSKSKCNPPINANLIINVDDDITAITVGGVNVDLSGISTSDLDTWNLTKQIPFTFKYGDTISISGVNGGGPGGMVATISYTVNGNKVSIETDGTWTCNGSPAWDQGSNGSNGTWADFPLIDSSARWIWAQGTMTATCSTVLSAPKTKGTLVINVDDIINSITVGGTPVDLSSFSQSDLSTWNLTKTIPFSFNLGDTIAIAGTNGGGPGGMVGTITYTDNTGNPVTVETDATWTCNGNPAWDQGSNGSNGTWADFPKVDSNAHWIWAQGTMTATCQTTLGTAVSASSDDDDCEC